MYIDSNKHAYGLGGAQIISGSRQLTVSNVYRYKTVTATVTDLKFNASQISGSFGLNTIPAGVDVFGSITEITQSSGVGIAYYGIPEFNINTGQSY
jgi:hypothetical protein